MSKLSSKTKLASALVGALAFAGSVNATELGGLQNSVTKTHVAAEKSQVKINKYFDQTQDLLFQYNQTEDTRESLKGYNDYLAAQVADQEAEMALIQKDIDYVDTLRQAVVPLMDDMVSALDKFVALDLPFNAETRANRVQNLQDIRGKADISLAEKFRLIFDAYSIETDYGRSIGAYAGTLDVDGSGKGALVDFFRLGRVALFAQSQDQKQAWMYDADSKTWSELDEQYLRELTKGIRIARKQGANDLFSLPIPAAESAQ
ncbi:DUF3450 domain-containing protein [Paraferrimonas sp. SM1919]|uniref:DUF3450 domain-containing protein n=1 Tax=Paraferrimonas sp. SM1919 TaxID=2662263 RepID=UPI0013D3C310|nr:DUF3450 domain-containing protein [Paraferrimonas sp. SM1919]